MTRSVLVLLLLTTACNTTDSLLLESTTTAVPKAGGVATSADGRFRIIFEPDSVTPGTEITIETIRDFEATGLVSYVYRVGPKDLTFARDAQVEYDLDAQDVSSALRFVRVDNERQDVLAGSLLDDAAPMMTARVRRLDRVLFAVWSRTSPSCGAGSCTQVCELCDPSEPSCIVPTGYCSATGVCAEAVDAMCMTQPLAGYNDPPGSGDVFVVNHLAFAGESRGLDLDGQCTANDCIDNRLWRLGGLLNDQIRQNVLGGNVLVLFEIAGVDAAAYVGEVPSATLKTYEGRDADDPPYAANNFSVPPGDSTCCEFDVEPRSLSGIPAQAQSRAPMQIERSRMRTLAPIPLQFSFVDREDDITTTFRLERSFASGRVESGLSAISEGLIGGAIPVNTLAQLPNPYCQSVNPRCPVAPEDSSMLQLVASLISPRPDIDLDGDGLECLLDTTGDGLIDLCCDGVGTQDACGGPGPMLCAGSVVPPVDPARPYTCALRPEMADGYSTAFEFTAVRATIRGVASP